MDKAALNSSLQPPFPCGSSSWDTTPPSPPRLFPGRRDAGGFAEPGGAEHPGEHPGPAAEEPELLTHSSAPAAPTKPKTDYLLPVPLSDRRFLHNHLLFLKRSKSRLKW